MKRRPRKAKARKLSARKFVKPKAAKSIAAKSRVSLDDFISAGARALDLKIDKAWMPAVRSNLQVTLRHGASVVAFALPDDDEPAPVFKA